MIPENNKELELELELELDLKQAEVDKLKFRINKMSQANRERLKFQWNNLDVLPEDGKDLWILNQQYEIDYDTDYPYKMKKVLKIYDAQFLRERGWFIENMGECTCVQYWTYKMSEEFLPKKQEVKNVQKRCL